MSLRERVSPSVRFVLDVQDESGKFSLPLLLSYDFDSLGLIEEHTGKSMLTAATEVFDNPSCKNVSVLLWAAVQENHPEYRGERGLKAVRKNLTLMTAKKAKDACEKAFLKQLPDEQVEKLIGGETAAPLEQSPEALVSA